MENETRNIGLKQAKVLCQLPHQKRLTFFAKGLPIIQESADGYWKASLQLRGFPREAEVLRGHAVEEAAKALILIDAARCPKKLVSQHMGKNCGMVLRSSSPTDLCRGHWLEAFSYHGTTRVC